VAGRTRRLHRAGRNDWPERHFRLSARNTWEENARVVAAELPDRAVETGAEPVVLAGDARERSAVHGHLPDGPRTVVLETGAAGGPPGPASAGGPTD
jgi:hypothetical protein